jgi:hypothetical protein
MLRVEVSRDRSCPNPAVQPQMTQQLKQLISDSSTVLSKLVFEIEHLFERGLEHLRQSCSSS